MASISQLVDKSYETMEFESLANAPVSALQGISAGDAEALAKAFNVKTIRDLAHNKYFLHAQAIVGLANAGKR